MNDKLLPGQTIGLVGKNYYGQELKRALQQSGYRVQHEALHDLNETSFQKLIQQVDRLFYCTDHLPLEWLDDATSAKSLQDSSVLAMLQDRILFKNFLDDLNVNTQPYAVILAKEDIAEVIDSIGFPCVLKSNQDLSEQYFIYEDTDITEVYDQLPEGPAILEAWIPLDTELAVVFSRSERGAVHIISSVEVVRRSGRVAQYITAPRMEASWLAECEEVTRQFAEDLAGAGVYHLKLLISAAGVIYVHGLSAVPPLVHFPEDGYGDSLILSEQVRLLAKEPFVMQQADLSAQYVILPLQRQQIERAFSVIMDHPQWRLKFTSRDWTEVAPTAKVADIIIRADQLQEVLAEISELDLY